MSLVSDLVVNIKANSDQFVRATATAQREMATIATAAHEVTRRASASFNTLEKNAKSAFHGIGSAFNALKKSLLVGLGLGAGSLYMFKEIAGGIDDMGDFSAQVGISTDKLQEWGYVVSTVGLNQEALFGSLKSATKAFGGIEAGTGKASTILKKYGIDTKQFIGLDAPDAILKLAEATRGLSTASQVRIFERMGGGLSNMLPMLKNGAEEFKSLQKEYKAMGAALSGGEINSAGNASDKLDKLGIVIKSFSRLIVANLADPVSQLIDKLVNFIKDSGGIRPLATKITQGVLTAAASFADTAAYLLDAIKTLVDAVRAISSFVGGSSVGTSRTKKLTGAGEIGVSTQDVNTNTSESLRQAADGIRNFRDGIVTETTKVKSSFDYLNTVVAGASSTFAKNFEKASKVIVDSAQTSAKKQIDVMKDYKEIILGIKPQDANAAISKIISDRRKPDVQLASKSFDDEIYKIVEKMKSGGQVGNSIQNLQNYINANKNAGGHTENAQATLDKIKDFSTVNNGKKAETTINLVIDVDNAGNLFARVADSKQIEDVTTKIVISTAAKEARRVAR